MQSLRSSLCTAISIALAITPFGAARAQQATYAACIDYASVPAGSGISFRFAGETPWRSAIDASRALLLTAAEPGRTAQVLIWKQMPQTDSDRGVENTRMYNVNLGTVSQTASCTSATANYQVRYGADGYTLAAGNANHSTSNTTSTTGSSESGKRDGPSPAAMAVGTLVVLGLLAALFGGSSTGGSSSSRSSSDRDAANQNAMQRRWDEDRARREAADRAIQERRNSEFQDRLTRPNSLGW